MRRWGILRARETTQEARWRRRRWGVCDVLAIIGASVVGRKVMLRHQFQRAAREDRAFVAAQYAKAAPIMATIEDSVGLTADQTQQRVGLNHLFVLERDNPAEHFRQVMFEDP